MKQRLTVRVLVVLPFWLILLFGLTGVSAATNLNPDEAGRALSAIGADEMLATLPSRRQAIARLQILHQQWFEAGDYPAAARALNRLGELQLKVNDSQAALHAHRQALSLARNTKNPVALADSLNGLAFAYLGQHNPAQAQKLLEEALMVCQAANYRLGMAQTYNHLSFLYVQQPPLTEAINAAQKAVSLWQELQNQRGEAQAHYRLGEAYLVLSRNTESLKELELSLTLWRTLGNNAEQATTLIEIAFLSGRSGDWQRVWEILHEAQPMIDQEAEPYIAGQLATEMGVIFSNYNLPELAKTYFADGLHFFSRSHDPEAEIGNLILLARAKFLNGEDLAAIAEFQSAIPRCAAINDVVNTAFAHEYLGEIYLSRGEYTQALAEFSTALKLFESFPRPRDIARVHTFMGQAQLAQNRLDAAFSHYSQALNAYKSFHNYNNEAALYHGLGQIAMKRGKLDEAGRLFKTSLELTEKLRADGSSQDLRTAFLAKAYPRYESYLEWLMQMHQRQPDGGFAWEALVVSERSRSRSLLETLQASRATLESGFDPQLIAQQKALEQQLNLKEKSQADLLSRQQDASDVAAELQQLNQQYEQVKATMAVGNPRFVALTQPRPLNREDILRLAPDDETALFEYSLGEKQSYLWVVTKAGFAHYVLPGRARIEESAAKLHNLLRWPENGGAQRETELRAAIKDLSQLVLHPAAANLRPRLALVTDGVLGFIPFQVLATAERPDEPLVENHEIINAPSLTTLAQLLETSAQRQPAPKIVAAFGDPVSATNYTQKPPGPPALQLASNEPLTIREQQMYSAWRDVDDSVNPAELPRLNFSAQEIQDITANASGGANFTALNFDATLETLRNTDLSQYRALHLSTHGLVNSKRPENSGIVLSMIDRQGRKIDGFLRLADVYNLNTPVDLVVLSACSTALGKQVSGEGLISLTRGFMYAGASSVASSLWKVDDEATAKLMKGFYEAMLREGKPPAAALREAQNVLRRQKAWRDPFYWAAFTFNGQSRNSLAPTPASPAYLKPVLLLLLFLVVISGLALWLRNRKTQVLIVN